MKEKQGLIAAYILDGKGGGKPISWDEIDTWTPEQGVLWVHLNYTNKRAKNWLLKKSGINKIEAQAMCIEESRPRSIFTEQGLLVFLRGVNLNPGQNPEDMVAVRVYIDKNRIITTRHRRLLSVNDLRENIDAGLGPVSQTDFLIKLNERLIYRMADAIASLDERVDELEENLLRIQTHKVRPQILEIRRECILLRRYLSPQRDALFRLQIEETPFLEAKAKNHMRELTDRLIRFVEDLDSLRDRASIMQEELVSRLSEQLDRRMYVLAIVTVIFLPLTFITGLLGINVAGIPGAEYKYGFITVCIMLAAISVVLIWLLKHKKWISINES